MLIKYVHQTAGSPTCLSLSVWIHHLIVMLIVSRYSGIAYFRFAYSCFASFRRNRQSKLYSAQWSTLKVDTSSCIFFFRDLQGHILNVMTPNDMPVFLPLDTTIQCHEISCSTYWASFEVNNACFVGGCCYWDKSWHHNYHKLITKMEVSIPT